MAAMPSQGMMLELLELEEKLCFFVAISDAVMIEAPFRSVPERR
jgi:hypothetical protein